MIAIGDELEVEPGFGEIDAREGCWRSRGAWHSGVDDEKDGKKGNVDDRRPEGDLYKKYTVSRSKGEW